MPADRLSLNQITVPGAELGVLLDHCRRAGIGKVGLWRHLLPPGGAHEARQICEAARIEVTSLCRGGFFTGYSPDGPPLDPAEAIHDTRAAIDEASALGSPLLVLVCGGSGQLDPRAARGLVAAGIREVAGHAEARGVMLGIEPLHPMFCADRSVVTTLADAAAIAQDYPPDLVGLVVDAYHVWWDPELDRSLERAAERIMALHVCDWDLATSRIADARLLPGEGIIDLKALRGRVEELGYDGAIEVEVLNRELWTRDPAEVVGLVRKAFDERVAR